MGHPLGCLLLCSVSVWATVLGFICGAWSLVSYSALDACHSPCAQAVVPMTVSRHWAPLMVWLSDMKPPCTFLTLMQALASALLYLGQLSQAWLSPCLAPVDTMSVPTHKPALTVSLLDLRDPMGFNCEF